jgi:hypothetical protein
MLWLTQLLYPDIAQYDLDKEAVGITIYFITGA